MILNDIYLSAKLGIICKLFSVPRKSWKSQDNRNDRRLTLGTTALRYDRSYVRGSSGVRIVRRHFVGTTGTVCGRKLTPQQLFLFSFNSLKRFVRSPFSFFLSLALSLARASSI